MKEKLIGFLKNDTVLMIALLLAIVSSFIVTPSKEYAGYIDFRVLVLLFVLMLVVGGFKSLGVFGILGEKMCKKVSSVRTLAIVLLLLCFFSSMLITNDVALITFVPFTISVFAMTGNEKGLIPVIVLETIAANLGSMMTPIGNPQNLLLFSISGMGVDEFIIHMLPLTALCLVLILACVFFIKNSQVTLAQKCDNDSDVLKNYRFWIYVVLFAVCLGNVFKLYSHWIVFAVVTLVVLILDRKLFKDVDYSLLLTFVGFFIFIGNVKQIETINTWLSGIIEGNELIVGILSSQVISNVPAAMLLSGFTTDYKTLLYGVNIGGLGTLIASMASLISYRLYCKAYPERKKEYFRSFTIYNIVMLVIIYVIVRLLF